MSGAADNIIPGGFTRRFTDFPDTGGNLVRLSFLDNCVPGPAFLFIHGLTTFGSAWLPLARSLGKVRCILPDLKGYAHSANDERTYLSRFDQALLIRGLAEHLGLEHTVVVTHSLGIACLMPAFDSVDFARRVDAVVMLSPAGLFSAVPDFVSHTAAVPKRSAIFRFAGPEALAALILSQGCFDPAAVPPEIPRSLSADLGIPGAREALAANAAQIALLDPRLLRSELQKLKKPVYLIRGENDAMADFYDSREFPRLFPAAPLNTLRDCGSFVHMERWEETGRLIRGFFHLPEPEAAPREAGAESANVPEKPEEPGPLRKRFRFHFHMSKLFDRHSPGTLLIFLFIKILQLLKSFGVKAKENGWRAATGVFLRHEYSKFALAVFRLRYFRNAARPGSESGVREQLTGNLIQFLRGKRGLHWKIVPGFFHITRKRISETDVVEAFYRADGTLEKIVPHFDEYAPSFPAMRPADLDFLLERFVAVCNSLIAVPEGIRSVRLLRSLKTGIWLRAKKPGVSYAAILDMRRALRRLLAASFIRFEFSAPGANRAATPDFARFPHPGFGLLNITARITDDFSEADLWIQFHHVPVDGLPMQELLDRLKHDWGVAGPFCYPAFGTPEREPERMPCGNDLWRARAFFDFSPLLEIRKKLNAKYRTQMRGRATVASLILWGLAQHPAFAGKKMLFPVDTEQTPDHDRDISLVFIRPADFIDRADPLAGFLRFEHEFNYRLALARVRRGESYEVMELYAMLHPVFYHLAQRLFPGVLSDIVGTMGVTVLRSAELFMAPTSDLQSDGFLAVGSLDMPCADGSSAGAVTVCGSPKKIRSCLLALASFLRHSSKYFPSRSFEPGERT